MSFGGQIVYSRTYSEVEKATKELLDMVEAKKQNMERISLGLDIEWRPTFRRGGSLAGNEVFTLFFFFFVFLILFSQTNLHFTWKYACY